MCERENEVTERGRTRERQRVRVLPRFELTVANALMLLIEA